MSYYLLISTESDAWYRMRPAARTGCCPALLNGSNIGRLIWQWIKLAVNQAPFLCASAASRRAAPVPVAAAQFESEFSDGDVTICIGENSRP